MKLKNELLNSSWTIRPTTMERTMGRLMRGPEEHEETVETKTEETTTLVTEPEKKEEVVEEVKTEETKTEETKTEEVKVEPLTVEALTLPEGFELQEEMANEFLEILNGDSSPQDRANALIALHTKNLAEAQEADSKAWEKMQTEWRDEVKADSDVGGDKLQPALANIGKLLDEFGSPELKGVFDMTGAGNNVHMIKFLNKIAGKLTEGNFFSGGIPSTSNDPDAAAKRMYPSMKG